jgi:hypothetical protein
MNHLAHDPEPRLVLAVVPGARSIENSKAIVAEPGTIRSWRSPTRRAGAGALTPTRHARQPDGREDGCSGYKTI